MQRSVIQRKETGENQPSASLAQGFFSGRYRDCRPIFLQLLVDRDVHEIERSCLFRKRSDTPIFEPESDWVNKIT